MENQNKNLRGLVRITAFILLCCILFVNLSYFAKPLFVFAKSYKHLRKEDVPIDVLFLGGSSTLVYWSPMLAFDRYGISSYNLSDSGMAPSLLLGLLEESISVCDSKLYVIDLRAFENVETDSQMYNEWFYHTYTDSIPYSQNRIKMIEYAYQFADFEYSPLSAYVDFIYHHGEWRSWKSHFRGESSILLYKGCHMPRVLHDSVILNPYTEVTARQPLSEDTVTILNDLLDFVEEKELSVLYLLNAYAFENAQERAIYNSIFDILEERGAPYLDTNLYYEEMGLDGATDFYNINHVNAIGMEKYTNWLTRWLVERYELEDHRNDPRFASWHEDLPAFYEEFDAVKQEYWKQIKEKEAASEG